MTRDRRTGFTLLEMLMATILAAAMMTAVLAVTASIRRAYVWQAKDVTDDMAAARLMKMLEQDAAMADSLTQTPAGLVIDGYGRLSATDQQTVHGPTRVEYRLVQTGGHGCLVRQQTLLDSKNNHDASVELIAVGLRSVDIAVGQSSPSATQPTTAPASTQASDPQAGYLLLSVQWEDPAAKPLNEKMIVLK